MTWSLRLLYGARNLKFEKVLQCYNMLLAVLLGVKMPKNELFTGEWKMAQTALRPLSIIEHCLCRYQHADMGSTWVHLDYNKVSFDMVQHHKYSNLHYPIC